MAALCSSGAGVQLSSTCFPPPHDPPPPGHRSLLCAPCHLPPPSRALDWISAPGGMSTLALPLSENSLHLHAWWTPRHPQSSVLIPRCPRPCAEAGGSVAWASGSLVIWPHCRSGPTPSGKPIFLHLDALLLLFHSLCPGSQPSWPQDIQLINAYLPRTHWAPSSSGCPKQHEQI